MFTIALTLLLLKYSSAGSLKLAQDIEIRWQFGDNSDISFEYQIPESIMAEYQWVGCGFKYEDEGGYMTKADIVNILFDRPVQDSYAQENGTPTSDVDLGTEENIESTFETETIEGYTVFSWSRALDTGDEFDKVFTKDGAYQFLWAFGKVKDGVQQKHSSKNNDIHYFILSDEDQVTETAFLSFLD